MILSFKSPLHIYTKRKNSR